MKMENDIARDGMAEDSRDDIYIVKVNIHVCICFGIQFL